MLCLSSLVNIELLFGYSDLQANVPTNLGAKEGISSGDKHTCAWSNEERPICWGERHGQSVPVGLVAPTQVQAMYQHSCALGNGITCWGRNFRGKTWG